MPRLLLVGWDGAGWNQIHPLLDSGAMPNLARIVEKGVMGDLATLKPLCSPLLWTSVATGTFADRHQILDTVEPDPVTGGVRPVTKASLGATQIWNILAREGLHGIALLSDGAARLTEVYHLMAWPALVDVLRDEGPAGLIQRVRAAEASDPDGTRWPRHKARDDATGLYWAQPGE